MKIVYLRGLWAHPNAVCWIKNNLEKTSDLEVDLFDYHDELIKNISNSLYLQNVIKKFVDNYESDASNIILIGHSHGGALATIINKYMITRKLILINPALRPWGIFRRIPNGIKGRLGACNIGDGYQPHFEIKYEGEIEDRAKYFFNNFRPLKDSSRIIYTGNKAIDSLYSIRNELLMIQSMQDEFVGVKKNCEFYNRIPLGETDGQDTPGKEIMKIPNGEHAILEERGEYPKIYKKINTFIKR